jgi:hypothetical protein
MAESSALRKGINGRGWRREEEGDSEKELRRKELREQNREGEDLTRVMNSFIVQPYRYCFLVANTAELSG